MQETYMEWKRSPLHTCEKSCCGEILWKVDITLGRNRATKLQAFLIFPRVLYDLPVSPILVWNSLTPRQFQTTQISQWVIYWEAAQGDQRVAVTSRGYPSAEIAHHCGYHFSKLVCYWREFRSLGIPMLGLPPCNTLYYSEQIRASAPRMHL